MNLRLRHRLPVNAPPMAYAVAVLLTAAALGLTALLAPPPSGHESMLFFAAVAGAAWYGGLGPALLATVLSALSLDGFFRARSIALGTRTHEDVLALVLFGIVAVAISALSEAQRAARRELALVADELAHERDQAQALASELEQQTEEAQALSEELEQANAEMLMRVTEAEHALGRAEESEQRFRFAANTAPVMIWSSDPLGACDWFNDPWLVFTGRAMQAEVGAGWLEGVHPDDRGRVLEATAVAFDQRRPFAIEFRLRRQDGSYRWVLNHGVPRHAPDSTFLGYIGSCIDITERRTAEDARREDQARKSAILDAALDCIVTMDADGRLTEFNRAAELMFGWARDEVMGRELADVMIPEAYRAAHRSGLARYLAGGDAHLLGRRVELTAIRRDGTEFPVELAVVRIDMPGPPAFTGYLRDITSRRRAGIERDRLVAELEAANAELASTAHELRERTAAAEAANRAKSDFLANMSHELRTPLNAIGGYAELLSMGVKGSVTQEQHEFLERISRSGRYLLRLINDILNFAKLEAGQVELRLEDVHIDATLRSIEALVAPQIRAKNLIYRYEPCDASVTAVADQEKVLQVVLNLVGNAIKFTEPGGSVRVWGDARDHAVCISVADTGCGIHAEKLSRIFDPFVQVDRALTTPGSQHGVGLGLAISRDLVKQMGGELSVDSTPGVGSTFRFTLPRSAPPAGSEGP